MQKAVGPKQKAESRKQKRRSEIENRKSKIKMSSHFKIHELLSASELEELEVFTRAPGRTVDQCHQWLLTNGFTLSRSAVGNWKQEFDATEKAIRARVISSGIMARLTDSEGPSQVAAATLVNLEQALWERSLNAEQEEAGDLLKLVKSAQTISQTKSENLELKEKVRTLEAKLKRASEDVASEFKGLVRPEDIAAARTRIFGS